MSVQTSISNSIPTYPVYDTVKQDVAEKLGSGLDQKIGEGVEVWNHQVTMLLKGRVAKWGCLR